MGSCTGTRILVGALDWRRPPAERSQSPPARRYRSMAVLVAVLALPCWGLKLATTVTASLPPASAALPALVSVSLTVIAPAWLAVLLPLPITPALPWRLAASTNVKVPGPGAPASSLRPPVAARAEGERVAR